MTELNWTELMTEIKWWIYCSSHVPAPRQLNSIGLAGVNALCIGSLGTHHVCFLRNLVGKTDSMANYSLLRVGGGRRKEKRMVNHALVVSQFLKSKYFFTRCVCVCVCVCVCEIFSLSENWLSMWRNITMKDFLWHVKSGWKWIGFRSFSKCFTPRVCIRGQK